MLPWQCGPSGLYSWAPATSFKKTIEFLLNFSKVPLKNFYGKALSKAPVVLWSAYL